LFSDDRLARDGELYSCGPAYDADAGGLLLLLLLLLLLAVVGLRVDGRGLAAIEAKFRAGGR
jgi:hypothetical protein